MRYQLRWILPIAQLLVCFSVLWPVRGRLLFGLTQARPVFAPTHKEGQIAEPNRVILLPELTPERLRALDAAEESALSRMRVPVILNFPVAVAQVPYLVVRRREWLPQGMFIETWRATIWPLAGLIFWWLAGRGIEALMASVRSTVHPRLSWIEVTWAILLLLIGIVALIGILTSTPDDRRDKDFMAFVYGGLLWGVLAVLTVSARFRQWRIYKQSGTGLLA
jgi:hypothetical protein